MASLYLDYCASTPIDKRVLDEMVDIYLQHYGNADSRTHLFGLGAKGIVEKSRKTIATLLHIDPSEVLFTSGATESDNIAILGLAEYGKQAGKMHVVTTAIEHKAVLQPMRQLEKQGYLVEYVKPDETGRMHAQEIIDKLRDDTLLVSIMHVNNETGVIQPIQEIGEAISQRKGIYYHIDAAQSFGKLNEELRNTPYDMLSISGHKIHGPQGVGCLVLRRKNYKRPPIEPLFKGGQQEYGFRPGTIPVALVAGLAKAAEIMDKEYPSIKEKLIQQRKALLAAFESLNYRINSDEGYVLPNVLNISFAGVDAESVFAALKQEYAISNGSACTSGSYAPSHVLTAMGLDEDRINQALRISWWTDPIDPKPLVDYIKETAI